MHFSFTNVRSIRNKYATISNFILSKNVDIFSVCETWLSDKDTNTFLKEITPLGYVLHSAPQMRKKGGGVACFTKNVLNSHIISTPVFTSFESMLISAKIECKTITFLTVCKPPSSNLSQFMEDFGSLLEILSSSPSPTVISGDFNIHIHSSKLFSKFLDSWNLTQHIDFPTHICGQTLDLLITSSDSDFLKSFHNADTFSDHVCISAHLDFSVPQKESECQKQIRYRAFYKINMSQLKADLLSSDLFTALAKKAHSLYHQYHSTLFHLLDKHAPAKTKKFISEMKLILTDELVKAKQQKRQENVATL
jgi:exonuclease III